MAAGFFFHTSSQPVKKTTPAKSYSSKVCPCGLEKTCAGPFMVYGGQGEKRILVIAEAPGKTEDEEYAKAKTSYDMFPEEGPLLGTQLIGEAGKRLEKELRRNGIDLHEDCWTINAVNCRPPENRTPTGIEIDACRPTRVRKIIEELKPKAILILGAVALQSILGERAPENSSSQLGLYRGNAVPDQELKAWLFPTFHPSYVLRQERGKNNPGIPLWFRKDIQNFAENFSNPLPITPDPEIVFPKEKEVIQLLRMIQRKKEPSAFDYETTGLKPYARGHEIICASVCQYPGDVAYSFMMTSPIMEEWKKFLLSPVPKIAHKIQFEEMWSRAFVEVEVNNWHWDSKLAAHCLDNRGNVSGLKFQTFLRFGISDYSQEINPFLRASTALGMNNIHNAPKDKLLQYCGEDSFYEMMLYKWQKENFPRKLLKGFRLFMEGAQALMDDEENGIIVNRKYLKEEKKKITEQVDKLKIEVLESDIGKKWKEKYPIPNLGSNPQLSHVLFNVLGLKSGKKTKKGNNSVDEEALEAIAEEHAFAHKIVQIRKLEKIAGTYLSGWETETGEDGIMRPFYNLHTVRTFRSSSQNPNLQNVPSRDKEAQTLTRRAIYPRAGHVLVEADYSGIEVRVGACYHKDPQMIKYITDPITDMHRDMAMECFLLEQEEVSKSARQGSKNQFVFPSFYGSYWMNTAPGLWKWANTCETAQGESLIKHLKKKGILRLGEVEKNRPLDKKSFLYHIREVEERFWGERFRVYAEWKDSFWEEYLENGYFDTLTGFRCSGPMRKNEVVNYPIQGSAFHCLLRSKYNTKLWIEEKELDILPCGQIHDSGLFSLAPENLDCFSIAIKEIWCEYLREQWKWINVPLEVEIEVTPVNGSWYEKKKCEAVP